MTGGWGSALLPVAGAALFAGLIYLLVRLSAPLFRRLPGGRKVRYVIEPPPAAWRDIVHRYVLLSRRLAPAEREHLLKLTQVFLRDVPIEGCNGLVVTEEMKVAIAAEACLLVVNLHYPWFPTLRNVLVYPDTFAPVRLRSRHQAQESDGPPVPTAGQAWSDGTVVLSWRDVRAGSARDDDGYNVVLHEFAHVLDSENGELDGVPLFEAPASHRAFGRVIADGFASHQHEVFEGEFDEGALDEYAATNRAEYFAVATEAFFERPVELQLESPELYAELRTFYRQDPAARLTGRTWAAP